MSVDEIYVKPFASVAPGRRADDDVYGAGCIAGVVAVTVVAFTTTTAVAATRRRSRR